MGSLLLSSESGTHKVLFVPDKTGVSVSPSPVEVLLSSPVFLQGQIPWGFPALVRSPGWEASCGIQNLHNSGRTLVLFSDLWVSHPVAMAFDFIMIAPLLLSRCSFFVFGHGVSFGRFQHPPVYGCSITSCNFGAIAGGDLRSTPPSRTGSSVAIKLLISLINFPAYRLLKTLVY